MRIYAPGLAFGPVTGLGESQGASCGREQGKSEADWSLAVVQLSLGIWDDSRYS